VNRHLPSLIEAAGATCLVIGAAHLSSALAWALAGGALVAKAFELERRDP